MSLTKKLVGTKRILSKVYSDCSQKIQMLTLSGYSFADAKFIMTQKILDLKKIFRYQRLRIGSLGKYLQSKQRQAKIISLAKTSTPIEI